VRLKWKRRALINLSGIYDYIREENPAAAQSVAERIQQSALRLKQFPLLGRPTHKTSVRLLQVAGLPYLLPYEITGDAVEILAVFDERQQRPDEWQ
jgi:toxin ParE1/3/4